ncbi:MAG: class I SAM-dependent methyltransferase [Dysgonamonadaceae bacterium]|jgi:ubiquinone/menaquinone biosynthesis C-methylase UbiE|nr:class I SAM-dependent methyltransferase [Dysgonamonadaceae bacterium]
MDINKIQEQFNSVAKKYDNRRRYLIPCFDDFYKSSISLLKYYRDDFKTIVDLGAGTGLLTKEMYELYPNAHYILIDIANDMLKIAEERLKGLDNFEFMEHNYVEDIPVKNCDLICSALSIHHLENDEKEALYKNIYKKLDGSGCFINLDLFLGETETIENLYNTWWYDYIVHSGITVEKAAWEKSRELDKENTIPETIKLLKNSGFRTVECIYSFMKFGVVIAIK